MTDIVERLRSLNDGNRWPMMDEAADEIGALREHVNALRLVATSHEPEALRLQADNERLQAVLHYISQLDDDGEAPVLARRALEHKP